MAWPHWKGVDLFLYTGTAQSLAGALIGHCSTFDNNTSIDEHILNSVRILMRVREGGVFQTSGHTYSPFLHGFFHQVADPPDFFLGRGTGMGTFHTLAPHGIEAGQQADVRAQWQAVQLCQNGTHVHNTPSAGTTNQGCNALTQNLFSIGKLQ